MSANFSFFQIIDNRPPWKSSQHFCKNLGNSRFDTIIIFAKTAKIPACKTWSVMKRKYRDSTEWLIISGCFQCWHFPLSLEQEQETIVALGTCRGDIGRVYPLPFLPFLSALKQFLDFKLSPLPDLFFINWFIFYWSIIALQYCVGFCHTSSPLHISLTYSM